MDAQTGAVVSYQAPGDGMTTQAVVNPCRSGNTCWQPSRIPYAQYGFTSPGLYTGNWQNRGTLSTGNHYVSGVCWLPPGSGTRVCSSITYNPNVGIGFTSEVTGVQVRLLT
jgi:hypothetical protein